MYEDDAGDLNGKVKSTTSKVLNNVDSTYEDP